MKRSPLDAANLASSLREKCRLTDPAAPLLLAISGGPDSTVLAILLKEAGYDFALAHMDFQLRGEESAADADFVDSFAKKLEIPLHLERVDTESLRKSGESIQMTARRLRYDWLESLRQKGSFDFILTAHHKDDQAETVLLNLVRGAGLIGLQGMSYRNGHILRPLLGHTKAEILKYAETHNLPFREDSSNAASKYKRNKVRNEVLPLLEELNPSVVDQLSETAARFREISQLYHTALKAEIKSCTTNTSGITRIAIRKVAKATAPSSTLHAILTPAGFSGSQISEIFATVIAPLLQNRDTSLQTGRHFLSKTHRLVHDRRHLLLMRLKTDTGQLLHFIEINDSKIHLQIAELQAAELSIERLEAAKLDTKTGPEIAQLASEKLKFPLELRRWKKGDYFYPFGLTKRNGKPGKKKLSDFLTDLKLDRAAKESTWVLSSGRKIAWVVGQRIDQRFAVGAGTNEIFRIKLKDAE